MILTPRYLRRFFFSGEQLFFKIYQSIYTKSQKFEQFKIQIR